MTRFTALFLLAPAVLAFDYTVGVGKDENTGLVGLGFDPSSIRPQPGDRIVFEYRAGSHSAVQSTFTDPCTPMAGGYDSGIQTVADGTPVDAGGLPTTEFIVADLNPVWFFDQAGGLCSKGAVFSVNPDLTGTQTAGQFVANAEATDPNPSSASDTPTASASTAAPASASSAPASASSPASASVSSPAPASAPASASAAHTSSGTLTTGSAAASSQTANAAASVDRMASFSMGASLAALGAWLFV